MCHSPLAMSTAGGRGAAGTRPALSSMIADRFEHIGHMVDIGAQLAALQYAKGETA